MFKNMDHHDYYVDYENANNSVDEENFFPWEDSLIEKSENDLNSLDISEFYPPHVNPLLENVDLPEPRYLADSEGNFIIYPGEITFLYGKPGSLKSWILMKPIGTCKMRYMDFENGKPTMKSRLLAMKTPVEDAGVFAFPETKQEILSRIREYIETSVDLVCIDGLPGLAREFGVNENNNDEVAKLFREVLDPLKRAGIAVVLLDHTTKDGNNDNYPIGAQTKLSQSGVAFLVKTRKDSNVVDLTVIKDRNYAIKSRCSTNGEYGWVELVKDENGLRAEIKPDLIAEINGNIYEPMEIKLLQRIHLFISENEGCSQTKIETGVEGATTRIREGIKTLELEGFISCISEGGKKKHCTLKPFKPEWRARSESSLNNW
jgi:hypothetical protein